MSKEGEKKETEIPSGNDQNTLNESRNDSYDTSSANSIQLSSSRPEIQPPSSPTDPPTILLQNQIPGENKRKRKISENIKWKPTVWDSYQKYK